MTFFTEVQQTIQTFLWSHQRPRIANAILRNTNQAGGITLPDLRQYHKASVLRTVWYWYQNRQTDHGIRRENPESNPNTYGHLIFAKGGKDRKMGTRLSFQQEVLGNLGSCMESRTPPHTMHRYKLNVAERLQCETRHHQSPGRKHRQNIF